MLVSLVAVLAASIVHGVEIARNGWYSCNLDSDTPSDAGSKSIRFSHGNPWNSIDIEMGPHVREYLKAANADKVNSITPQCAHYQVPMCHTTICNKTDSMWTFVKRLPASNPESKKAIWILQGGPGASSVNMEGIMQALGSLLDGEFSLYTMDHRGTGRSQLLDCVASQATAAGSPGGTSITNDELQDCITDINIQYGGEADIFSVTSAASDINYIISNEPSLATSDVYIYGVSYGTYLVERLMHLSPPNVKGYILDSVQAEVFPVDSNLAGYYSNWDRDYGQVANDFLSLCTKDDFCRSQIGPNARDTLLQLYEDIDRNTSACSSIAWQGDVGSIVLRKYLASLLMSMKNRVMIPAIIKRFTRCNEQDKEVLNELLNGLGRGTYTSPSATSLVRSSELLYNTIVYSEIWEPKSEIELKKLFMDQVIASGLYQDIEKQYCLSSNDATSICTKYNRSSGFIYKKPLKYWNQTASIPSNASVLVLSGGLDPQTPQKYATFQYNNMNGTRKRHVTFPIAAHGTINTTPVQTPGKLPCGYTVIASYLLNHGDVTKVDESCQQDIRPLHFKIDMADSIEFFSSNDAFDGGFDSQAKLKSVCVATPKMATVTVLSILLGLSLIFIFGLIYFLFQLKKKEIKKYDEMPIV